MYSHQVSVAVVCVRVLQLAVLRANVEELSVELVRAQAAAK